MRLLQPFLVACCCTLSIGKESPHEDDGALLMPFLRRKASPVDLMPFLHKTANSRASSHKFTELTEQHMLVQGARNGHPPMAEHEDPLRGKIPIGREAKHLDPVVNQELLYKLYDDVFHRGYRKDVRPMPTCEASGCPRRTDVRLNMRVLQVLGLNADDSTLTMQVVLNMMWPDSRLTFNSSKYFKSGSWDSLGNSVPVNAADIWVPDIVLANTADPHDKLFSGPHAVLYDGEKLKQDGFNVRMSQPAIVRVKCAVDLADFPMDQQSCKIVFRSWASSSWLELTSVESKHLLSGLVDASNEYDVVSLGAKQMSFPCPDSGELYPQIVYSVQMARRPEYYYLNVVLPLQLLALLSMGTLYIAPGVNRIFYGVTLVLTLMSVTFFMASYLPKHGGGNTWLENYEQEVYMTLISPLLFALLTEVYCRITRRNAEAFSETDELELTESIETADTYARIVFGAWLGYWILSTLVVKLIMIYKGTTFTLLPFKVYNWLVAVLLLVVMVADVRTLLLRRSRAAKAAAS